jgi:hypothetical protein
MSGFAEPWVSGFDPATGTLALPLWPAAVIAALFVGYCAVVLHSAGRVGIFEAFSRAGLLLVGAAAAWVVLDATSAGGLAAQRRALDARLLELTTRAVMPGSALACLDATAGELVEESCEKALFASPEATAASVAYVVAQLSLLADGSAYERRGGVSYEAALGGLRRAVEIDRYGIVAHVLADREGCTADRCGSFGLLRDTTQVTDNLTEHKYDAVVMHHASEWLQSALSLMAANSPSASPSPALPASPAPAQSPPSAAAGKPNRLYFPSSASIPAVSIMSAEPTAAPPQQAGAPADASGKPPAAVTRKPTPATSPTPPTPLTPASPSQQGRRPANPAAPGQPAAAPGQASYQ